MYEIQVVWCLSSSSSARRRSARTLHDPSVHIIISVYYSSSSSRCIALAFVDDLFRSLKVGPSFLSFFFGVLRRLRNLAVQRCGGGF